MFACWLLQVPATCYSVSQGRICLDKSTCCHTIEVADQTFYLTQSQYTDTGPTSPTADPIVYCQVPGRVATGVPIFKSLVWLDPEKARRKRDVNPGSFTLEADALTTRPMRRSLRAKTVGCYRTRWLSKYAWVVSRDKACVTYFTISQAKILCFVEEGI